MTLFEGELQSSFYLWGPRVFYLHEAELLAQRRGQQQEDATGALKRQTRRRGTLHGEQTGQMQMDQKHGLYFAY